MSLTVKNVCEPRKEALDAAMSQQVEDIRTLLKGSRKDAQDFFSKTHLTDGLRSALGVTFDRLSGKSDQCALELKQAMGGGKTHLMLATGFLAKYPSLASDVLPDVEETPSFESAKVAVIDGRENYADHHLWGEIAQQLGDVDGSFTKFWKNGAKAPSPSDWVDLIGTAPTLILVDELPPYLEYAETLPAGGGTLADVATRALSNLAVAIAKLPSALLIYSNLSGTYEKAGAYIKNIGNELKRRVGSDDLKVLFATDAAAEGINLQRLGTVINIDLPWNPAKLGQRIGRIHRIGQLRSAINVVHLLFSGSRDVDIYQRLHARLEHWQTLLGIEVDFMGSADFGQELDDIAGALAERERVLSKIHPLREVWSQETTPDWKSWQEETKVISQEEIREKLLEPWKY